METKKCIKCGRELPLTEFHKNKRNPDALSSYCKTCACDYQRARYAIRHEASTTLNSGGVKSNYTDPDFDGKTTREVMDIMVRCKRWLEAHGCTIHLSGEYTEVKKLKF